MVDSNGEIYPYIGGGLMTPGFSYSGTGPTNKSDMPVPGWTVTAQGANIISGQYGYSFGNNSSFKELGAAPKGWGVTGYYVFEPINLGNTTPSGSPDNLYSAPTTPLSSEAVTIQGGALISGDTSQFTPMSNMYSAPTPQGGASTNIQPQEHNAKFIDAVLGPLYRPFESTVALY